MVASMGHLLLLRVVLDRVVMNSSEKVDGGVGWFVWNWQCVDGLGVFWGEWWWHQIVDLDLSTLEVGTWAISASLWRCGLGVWLGGRVRVASGIGMLLLGCWSGGVFDCIDDGEAESRPGVLWVWCC
jgi:hypothetical protein